MTFSAYNPLRKFLLKENHHFKYKICVTYLIFYKFFKPFMSKRYTITIIHRYVNFFKQFQAFFDFFSSFFKVIFTLICDLHVFFCRNVSKTVNNLYCLPFFIIIFELIITNHLIRKPFIIFCNIYETFIKRCI